MTETFELKEKWSEAISQIQHKTGGINYDAEYMFISNLIMTALMNKKPLTTNEIETIEAHIRIKLFNHGLLRLV